MRRGSLQERNLQLGQGLHCGDGKRRRRRRRKTIHIAAVMNNASST
jgi:hypothetical protein